MNKLPSIHLNQVEFKTLMQEASNKYNMRSRSKKIRPQ